MFPLLPDYDIPTRLNFYSHPASARDYSQRRHNSLGRFARPSLDQQSKTE